MTIQPTVPQSIKPAPSMPQPALQTVVPTPAISDICAEFSFNERRKLQDGGEDCSPNMLVKARENPNLSTVVELLELARFDDVFACAGPFTGFFPQNDAFAALDQQILDFLVDPANIDALQGLLLYHLLPGTETIEDLTGKLGEIQTLLPAESLILKASTNATNGVLQINDAFVVESNVLACNGIIHVIDDVLLPLEGKFYPSLDPRQNVQ